MDWKLEVVVVPVTDVDRAKSFYVGKLGFHLDADIQPSENLRVVHMTARSVWRLGAGNAQRNPAQA